MRIDILLGRDRSIFEDDILYLEEKMNEITSKSRFLILGGGGTIGQAVCKEIFIRNPKVLHVVDIAENNLVELVRDLRSSVGYIDGEFDTFSVPIESTEFEALIQDLGPYDYVLNLSALKHVRNEKDPYTLARMIQVNIINTLNTLELFEKIGINKYFCVSTDKAANPANLMGATKRIMEDFLQFKRWGFEVSSARFANVAFSDGSLLHGFRERLNKRQPLSAPMDTRRYFITPKEAGELCLVSCLFGNRGDILIPKLSPEKDLMRFDELAVKFLEESGLSPKLMDSEQEARDYLATNSGTKFWPCYFFKSDTTGEKSFEEFFTDNEVIDLERFSNFGVVQMKQIIHAKKLNQFKDKFDEMLQNKIFDRDAYKALISSIVPELRHIETGKFLNSRM